MSVQYQPGQLSPDGHYYWDGAAWLPTLAPDGQTRWNGSAWLPVYTAMPRPSALKTAVNVIWLVIGLLALLASMLSIVRGGFPVLGLAIGVLFTAGASQRLYVTYRRSSRADR